MAKYEKWLTPDGLVRIGGWARDGLTDEQIAHNMGISRSTLNAWKKRFSDISDTIGKGKDVVDRQVENALLKRAMGTTTTDKMYRMVHKDDDVLDMERRRFSNAWKLKHPEASKKEIDDAAIAGVRNISAFSRLKIFMNFHLMLMQLYFGYVIVNQKHTVIKVSNSLMKHKLIKRKLRHVLVVIRLMNLKALVM